MCMSRHAVTQHLNVLEAANLVSVTWRGREKVHALNPVPLHGIYTRWVRKFEQRPAGDGNHGGESIGEPRGRVVTSRVASHGSNRTNQMKETA
jgi:hypothetical protein